MMLEILAIYETFGESPICVIRHFISDLACFSVCQRVLAGGISAVI